ncbi:MULTISPECIES: hypothetical protein [unclassified Mesorhizobium]|uniref:hypothetical protein n=1 Tax=unclassified Mesorhizobium TaxID=325217 RepID=UPI00192596FD|nr:MULTISPECIES: hypothetical protein [unclassified Mesorhizobium]BCG97474.1 hypothetical protein MesoLj131a_63380 [Mesorhizobium sp. 131-2-1]BCH04542.1 hypothetical protein MesoLj131b_65410 [Mesorhizobium sp. 131-2-5]
MRVISGSTSIAPEESTEHSVDNMGIAKHVFDARFARHRIPDETILLPQAETLLSHGIGGWQY